MVPYIYFHRLQTSPFARIVEYTVQPRPTREPYRGDRAQSLSLSLVGLVALRHVLLATISPVSCFIALNTAYLCPGQLF